MDVDIPLKDRTHLRELARKKAGYAALPIMEERRQLWYAHNDRRDGGPRAPFIVETWTFDDDFMPEDIYTCTTPDGRAIEKQLLREIRNHELIDDDKVIEPTFDIGWFLDINEFGVTIERERAADAGGRQLGFRIDHAIKDLERDIERLHPAVCAVDRERTAAWQAFIEELFGDILTVRLICRAPGCNMLTHRVVDLMGMEGFFTAMYDCPEAVHRLMGFLRNNALRVNRWAESERLLRVNNRNEQSFGSSYNWTTRLPAADYAGPPARLNDLWDCANSQETVGVSPALFREFCFPYYRDVCEPFGLIYYGCCEPVHPFWADLRHLPNLKKVSISKWCDEAYMGEALQGTGIVYSRKPDPRFLGVDVNLDEDGWRAHVRTTLEATRGVAVEFIVRDVYTIHGNLDKPRRMVEIARDEIARHYD